MIKITSKRTFMYKNVVSNIYTANAGEGLPRHSHTELHTCTVVLGKVVVRKENKELVLTPDSMPVLLKSHEWHEIEALEDNTFL